MIADVLVWGSLAGLVHFVVIGLLYGNPVVDRLYREETERSSAVKRWASKPRYLLTQFLGTQVEVYLLAVAFVWFRPMVTAGGFGGALLLGLMLAALRVYPRFWNMWIQSTYPVRLLATEAVNGTIGTLVVVVFLQAVSQG
jgi:hypothetical protein